MAHECYLLDGQYDQVASAGILSLDGQGRLSFTLDKQAGTRGKLRWIEKALGQNDLHDRNVSRQLG
jgi:hypothetical protein